MDQLFTSTTTVNISQKSQLKNHGFSISYPFTENSHVYSHVTIQAAVTLHAVHY